MKEKQTTTTELEAVALGQAHIYIHTECGWVKHVSGIPTRPPYLGQWCNSTT